MRARAAAGENAPVLLSCEWSPKDPSVLAAAGTDALARVWTVSRAATSSESDFDAHDSHHVNGVNRPFLSLVDNATPRSATVSQIAWNSVGSAIAVAIDNEGKTSVQVRGTDGSQLGKFD
ncbi:hypothetical protein BN1723_017899, partial [Verticillium longisporum]